MLTSASNLYQNATLADAAYVTFTTDANGNVANDPLQIYASLMYSGRFDAAQAQTFVENWTVVNQFPDNENGFSATVFKNRHTGEFVFANRGTNGPIDILIADGVELVINGLAFEQIVDMYNYWQRLLAPAGSTVRQAVLTPVTWQAAQVLPPNSIVEANVGVVNAYFYINFQDTPEAGLGHSEISSSLIGSVGHSLGGHLAVAFSRLFNTNAFSVNGAGYPDGVVDGLALNAQENIANLFSMLGGAIDFDPTRIMNAFGDLNPQIVTQDLILHQQGAHAPLYIENGSVGATFGHSASGMTASSAVYDLLIRLDSALSQGTSEAALIILKPIFDAASNSDRWGELNYLPSVNATLETIVNSIASLFGVTDRVTVVDDRSALFAVIRSIENSTLFQQMENRDPVTHQTNGLFNVVSLAGRSPQEMVAMAKQDRGYLEALLSHNVFALAGNDAFYYQNDQSGRLDVSKYSNEFLLDSAKYLELIIKFNTGEGDDDGVFNDSDHQGLVLSRLKDRDYSADWDSESVIGNWNYTGFRQQQEISLRVDGVGVLPDRIVHLGNSSNEELIGGVQDDRLYGMDGNDHLTGNKGNDHLEGGNGWDVYVVGQGYDTIVDKDGKGRIEWPDDTMAVNYAINGVTGVADPASNWKVINPNAFYDTENDVYYLITDNGDGTRNLTISSPTRTDGRSAVTIRDFHEGDLGISLLYVPPAVPLTVLTSESDLYGMSQHPTTGNGRIFADGGAGNDLLSGFDLDDRLIGGDGDDFLIGGLGADHMEGGNGNDFIGDERMNNATGNDDLSDFGPQPAGSVLLASGTGWQMWRKPDQAISLVYHSWFSSSDYPEDNDDYASGGAGDDHIWMNVGNDIVSGGEGNDYIEGGHDHDVLQGDAGDDVIFGDAGGRNGNFSDPELLARFTIEGNDQISGGDGNDTLVGNGGNDVIHGDEGSDFIYGDNSHFEADYEGNSVALRATGDDILSGGAGNDVIQGGGGDDIISGGTGDDEIYGDNALISGLDTHREFDGNDQIDGGEGNDRISGMGGHDIIEGGDGNDLIIGDFNEVIAGLQYGDDFLTGGAGDDVIFGNAGNDYLDGGTGNDSMAGGEGADTLRGGAGNDYMDGGAGNDIYIIDANWGRDRIGNISGNETIKFAAGVNPSALVVSVDHAGRLVISDPNTESVLWVDDFFSNTNSAHRLEFANGTVWTAADLQARFKPTDGSFNGGASSDTIVGDSGNNTINGNLGSDTLLGGSGDDYILGGADEGYSYSTPDNDALFGGEGNDRLDGEVGNDFLDGGVGNDTLNGGSGSDDLRGGAGNDVLNAGWWSVYAGQTWHDTSDNHLEGGSGDDRLTGGLGRNTYSFAEGFGNDKIYLTQASGTQASFGDVNEAAVLSFAAGIAASELTFSRNGDDLIIAHGSDRITVVGYSIRGSATVELTFADGSVLSLAQQNFLSSWQGTAAPETLSGTSGNDVLNGFGGNDTLYGNAGNDIIIGGAGADRLEGGTGDDTYRYGLHDGVDYITGSAAGSAAGTDVLELGAGITRSDISLYKDTNNLYVMINATGNYIKVSWSASATDQFVDLIRFSDGTSLTATEIQSLALPMNLELVVAAHASEPVTLEGNQYANTLIVGQSVRDAVLIGGAGDDTYSLEGDYSRTIIEAVDGGDDTVYTSGFGHVLADNVENVIARMYGGSYSPGYQRTFVGNSLSNIIDVSQGGVHEYGYRLDGGAGNDILVGGSSNDTFVLDSEGDLVVESSSSQSIDTIEAAFSYSIAGNSLFENITLTGNSNTTATGNELNNRLDGSLSTGANTLTGGLGDDTYVLGAGDIAIEAANQGIDALVLNYASASAFNTSNYQHFERFELGAAAGASSITGGSGAEYLVGNHSINIIDGGAGDDVLYASSPSATEPSFDNDQLFGGEGNDSIYGSGGSDKLFGGDGNDNITGGYTRFTSSNFQPLNEITGGKGNDVLANGLIYHYSRGDGADTINDTRTPSASYIPRIKFGADIEANDVRLSREGEALVITFVSSPQDRITIPQYWRADGTLAAPIGLLEFTNGAVLWNAATIVGRAMSVTLTGTVGDDNLVSGAGFDTLIGNAGNDYLNAGAGDDTLDGGTGNDTYIFDSNYGNDRVINLNNASAGVDVIQVAANFIPGNGGFSRTVNDNGDLIFELISKGTTITLEGFMLESSPVHEIHFMDGTIWTRETIRGDMLRATEFGDYIHGLPTNDAINALGGDDYVYAGSGNDIVHGNDGNDYLQGDAGNDQLFGDAGDDRLSGGLGTDTLTGGVGNDTYYISDTQDTIVENAGEGTDVVIASVENFTLTANVENLVLNGVIAGNGNTLNNRIEGNEFNNMIDGGTGTDTMLGGLGDDTYVVDVSTDVVTESSSSGTDTVLSSASTYLLSSNVENLTLIGSANISGTGNSLANTMIGNAGNNNLSGGSGNDRLEGGAGTDTLNGGTGNDIMLGGTGNDIYIVDATGDVVTENLGEGTDLVQSGISYTLSANVENLTLTGTATTATGNALDNVLTGNNANNTLIGDAGNDTLNGGSGADAMRGGTGNDSYVVDNTGDVITENVNEGIDSVSSSISFDLSRTAHVNIENLTLNGTATTATGNALDNVLIGNNANNTLIGNAGNDTLDGGAGADALRGGVGNDNYVVDNIGDVITENLNEGTDTVSSSITFNLSSTANVNIENLTLTGTSNINGTGNNLNNVMTGNSGDNTLSGGAGNDTLSGGAGNDTLTGGSGVNRLFGGDGNDIMSSDAAATGGSTYEGGKGNDTITGGQQNDTYRFNIGDGQDTIMDAGLAGFTDVLSFGAGIASGMLSYTRIGNNLLISVNGSADTITVNNWYAATTNQIEQISFANGTSLNASQIQALTTGLVAQTASVAPTASAQSIGNNFVSSTTTLEENIMTQVSSDHRFLNQDLLGQIQSFNDLMRPGHSGIGARADSSIASPVEFDVIGRDEYGPGVIEFPLHGEHAEQEAISSLALGQMPGRSIDGEGMALDSMPGTVSVTNTGGYRAADGSLFPPSIIRDAHGGRGVDGSFITAPGIPGSVVGNRSADGSFIAPGLPSNNRPGGSLPGVEAGVSNPSNRPNAMAFFENRMQRRLERQSHMAPGALRSHFDEHELEYLIQSMARFGSNAGNGDSIKPIDQDRVQPIVIVPPSI